MPDGISAGVPIGSCCNWLGSLFILKFRLEFHANGSAKYASVMINGEITVLLWLNVYVPFSFVFLFLVCSRVVFRLIHKMNSAYCVLPGDTHMPLFRGTLSLTNLTAALRPTSFE